MPQVQVARSSHFPAHGMCDQGRRVPLFFRTILIFPSSGAVKIWKVSFYIIPNRSIKKMYVALWWIINITLSFLIIWSTLPCWYQIPRWWMVSNLSSSTHSCVRQLESLPPPALLFQAHCCELAGAVGASVSGTSYSACLGLVPRPPARIGMPYAEIPQLIVYAFHIRSLTLFFLVVSYMATL